MSTSLRLTPLPFCQKQPVHAVDKEEFVVKLVTQFSDTKLGTKVFGSGLLHLALYDGPLLGECNQIF